ncbi:O-methyl transferase B protein [Rutstroemia sp. NJR-2017a BBW]|nr:O-methyl transferase B protein [Rutstroemia sp. NJR-2017a BBW]
MDALIPQVKQLAEKADESTRRQLIDQLHELAYSLESSDDTMQRLTYRQLEIVMIRVGEDLKVFELLASSESPLTVEKLSKETGAAPTLLGRILRYLASMKLIKETGKDQYTSTNITKTLAVEGNKAGVYHQFNLVGPMWADLPNYLSNHEYRDMTDSNDTCWHSANKTDEHIFSWVGRHPEVAANFGKWMAQYMQGQKIWLDTFPIDKEVGSWKPKNGEDVLLVDVGGNIGPLLDALKAKIAGIEGRVILQEPPKDSNLRSGQDQPHKPDTAAAKPAVETTVHDMHTPQPVKNAKFYYIRSVFHDFPDDKCRSILGNIVPAMGEDSVILIDEKIFPDSNVNWKMAQIDISMMACFASIERTEAMWGTLLDSVGLKAVRKYLYQPEFYDGVLVVERK